MCLARLHLHHINIFPAVVTHPIMAKSKQNAQLQNSVNSLNYHQCAPVLLHFLYNFTSQTSTNTLISYDVKLLNVTSFQYGICFGMKHSSVHVLLISGTISRVMAAALVPSLDSFQTGTDNII